MAEELGTWPAEQATVLLTVLQEAGLQPVAKRTRDGILVTVPDDESDEAHRQLVTHMDAIAQAARPLTAIPGGKRRPAKRRQRRRDGDGERRLASERLLGMARPLGLGLVLLLVLTAVQEISVVLALGAIFVLVYLLGKQAQARGDDPGDHRRG